MTDEKAAEFLKEHIAYFIERQKIVARAMLDIHPRPLQMAGTHILGIEIAPYVHVWEEKMNTDKRFARSWQSGIWQGEWKHFAHGFGCLLANLRTGEPIEWDAPDLQAFEKSWFWNHIEWHLAQGEESQTVKARLKELMSAFQALCDDGVLVSAGPSKLKFG